MTSVTVRRVLKVKGKRIYNKELACFYCDKVYHHRIKTHLVNQHSDKKLVAQALAKNGKEGLMLLARVKNLGNFKRNIKVMLDGTGNLIVNRRPGKAHQKDSSYLPCIHCYGFYHKRELWRHCRRCYFNKTDQKCKQTGIIARARLLLAGGLNADGIECGKTHSTCCVLREPSMANMRRDEVYEAMADDGLILSFGRALFDKLGSRRAHDIGQRMRQLGRLKITLNSITNQQEELSHFISPAGFDQIIESVKVLAGFRRSEERIQIFDVPSLALRLGHNLIKCAEIKRGFAIRNREEDMRRNSDDYILLHSSEWNEKISSVALASMKTNKFNKPEVLPLTEDIMLLRDFLDKNIPLLMTTLTKNKSAEVWKRLAGMCMARILLFNKRRSGEVSELLLNTYTNRPDWKNTVNKEIHDSLRPVEKRLLQRYV